MSYIAREIKRTLWGVRWISDNSLDGRTEHLMYRGYIPALFKTRREARKWVKQNYGYIAERNDLRKEPHGWMVPRVVRVYMTAKDIG